MFTREARMLVPTFGSWDTGTDIPFTTVFEKVRATKDGKPVNATDKPSQTPSRTHRLAGNPSSHIEGDKLSNGNGSSELNVRGKRSVLDEWGFQRKGSDLSSRSSLEQIADHIFTESQHAAGNDTPVISRQSTSSSTSWQNNQAFCTRDLREQYVKEGNIYNFPISGGPLSVYHQGYQLNGSRMAGPAVVASPQRERFSHNRAAEDLYAMPATMQVHVQQPLETNHLSTEMPQNKVLPKFGDWDKIDPAGVEFTVIFDKARNERKCSVNQDDISRKATPGSVDEDLYKPVSTQRRSGFWALLCCSDHTSTT